MQDNIKKHEIQNQINIWAVHLLPTPPPPPPPMTIYVRT